MDNYYVEFLGELKDDRKIQKRFAKHYNKWCEYTNECIEDWNIQFDEQWTGEPIQDYSENVEYEKWILDHYAALLQKVKMDQDSMLDYEIGDYCQLYGIGRHGKRKGKRISFVLKRG